MKKRNIIIDCDPGIDDTFAISLALAHPEQLNLLGITTVAGNQTIEMVSENARKLVSFYGKDNPIAKGATEPLLREKQTAGEFHGANGMGNQELPVATNDFVKENAVNFLRDKLKESKEKITLVAIGPLTNIALLLKIYPEVKDKIEMISIMGGAASGGNVTQSAEFNIWADPEAAKIVFDSSIPIVMSGLDVTNDAGLKKEDMLALKAKPGKATSFLGSILAFYFDSCHSSNDFVALHDVSAIMYLLHPEFYEGFYTKVQIDCSQGWNRGNTCCDFRNREIFESPSPYVLRNIDADKFRNYLMESLLALDDIL